MCGEPVFLEVGFFQHSRFPKVLQNTHLSYDLPLMCEVYVVGRGVF